MTAVAREDVFWMIWCPNGKSPTRRHNTLQSVHDEAERLARAAPGEVFVVLEAKYAMRLKRPDPPPPPPVERVPLADVDGIPF